MNFKEYANFTFLTFLFEFGHTDTVCNGLS